MKTANNVHENNNQYSTMRQFAWQRQNTHQQKYEMVSRRSFISVLNEFDVLSFMITKLDFLWRLRKRFDKRNDDEVKLVNHNEEQSHTSHQRI